MEINAQLHGTDMEEAKPDNVLQELLHHTKLYSRLYPHQRDGILFLINSYKNGTTKTKGSQKGAILADEMGLGKSIQVIVFLHDMFMNTQEFKNAMIVVPAGLLNDWKDKLDKWTPKMNVFIYHNSEKELPRKLRHLQKTGGILLVSYKMFIYHYKTLTTYKANPFVWDCLVFDEAHKLKNPASKTHKAAALISAGFRVLMTGTPMHNNLKEYWTLFSLVSDTCLLGTYKTFKTNFENPITKGMQSDSGPEERALGIELQETLRKITKPFLLRRRKDEIQNPDAQTPSENIPSEQVLRLPKKNEYVVWISLSPEQEAAYRSLLDESSSLTLQSIHSLLAVCTHPQLNSDITGHEMSGVHLADSGKLAFMLALLKTFTANGNFVLVFSNYIKTLDIIQNALARTTWGRKSFLRIDGKNINQRDNIVRRFQKKRSENILLLTTSVGAEGLTLTAADSVVFADISWNQSQDAQAVGRAHRIGQTKEVKTYRLITCGTLEETIYRRQLFKGSLTRQAMGDEQNPLRHFTQEELKAMLTLQETRFSSTQQQLKNQGAKILEITEVFGEVISSLEAASVVGISDHGQLLSASQGEDLEVEMARMHITENVKMCEQEIEAEFHLTRQQICKDVSVKKPFRKAQIKRRTQGSRTPGLPRKYKCFNTPFSGTRRKTLHISRPCVFESSDESTGLSSDDNDVNISTFPHVSVTVKSEATGECNATDFMKNLIGSKNNSRITELLNPRDTEYLSKPHQITDFGIDIASFIDPNKDVSHVTDLNKDGSCITDLEKDCVTAVTVNLPVYHEHISTPDNSVSGLDSMDNTCDSEYHNDSHNSFCEYPTHSTTLESQPLPESQKMATLKQMSQELQLEDSSSEDFQISNPFVRQCDYSLTPSCISLCRTPPARKGEHNIKTKEFGECKILTEEENPHEVTFTELNKQNSSKLDKLSDLKEEAICQLVKFTDQRKFHIQVNKEYSSPLMPLNLNSLFCEHPPYSTIPESQPSPKSQKKAILVHDSQEIKLAVTGCENFNTALKSNQVVPELCDYSFTPSRMAFAGKQHYMELKQLGECDVLKEAPQECTNSEPKRQEDSKYEQKEIMYLKPFLDLSRNSEFDQDVNPPLLASESFQSSSEIEKNINDQELSCTTYEDSFKSRLNCCQVTPVNKYSFIPVEKEKHILDGNFQSTPLQSRQVVQQESHNLFKRLPFIDFHLKGKAYSTTPVKPSLERKLDESSNLKTKKKTPGLPRKYKCFPPSLVKTGRRKSSLIFQRNDSNNSFPKFHESTFSSRTSEWKCGKQNHDRLIPEICGYSPNLSALSQATPQTHHGQRQGHIREDTGVESTQPCPMNVDTHQSGIVSIVNTTLSEMFSSNNALFMKALRSLVIPKQQCRKMRQGSLRKSKRLTFSVTYRRHKEKLLNSMKNNHTKQITEKPQGRRSLSEDIVTSDAHVSLIPSEHVKVLVRDNSLSPSGPSPKLTKGKSPPQNIQRSIQDQFINPFHDIPEGESVQSTKTVNMSTEESDLSTSFTQIKQVIQRSNIDDYLKLQECSTVNTGCGSLEDEDHELHSEVQSDLLSLSNTSSVYKTNSETSNGQIHLKSFASKHELLWEMSLSPGVYTKFTPRKESDIIHCTDITHDKTSKAINEANSIPDKMRLQTCNDTESELELAIKSCSESCSISESEDDCYDSTEQALTPERYPQSHSNYTITQKGIDEIPESSEASQLHNHISRDSGVRGIQLQAQDIEDCTELPNCYITAHDDRNESMFRNKQNDTKSENESGVQKDVEDDIGEMFRLLHNLKRL